jgi:hypothetical protein
MTPIVKPPKPQPMRPSFESREPLKLIERPPTERDQTRFINAENSYLRLYRLGECTVVVTKEFGKWHLSIAHRTRYPTWDEVAEARYRILPDSLTFAMLLPPKREYINLHEFCFQVHEIDHLAENP